MTGSSSLESSKRLRKPDEMPPASSSLESAMRLEKREPEDLAFGSFARPSLFFPPYERLKLGMWMPLALFLPVEESRKVVRIADELTGRACTFCLGEEPVEDKVRSENRLEERAS
jgi:hypothetical protein